MKGTIINEYIDGQKSNSSQLYVGETNLGKKIIREDISGEKSPHEKRLITIDDIYEMLR